MKEEGDGALRVGEQAQGTGIVDCLSAGFGKLNGMLWVLLLPVLMSLFLWRGPALSAEPAVNAAMDWYSRMGAQEAQVQTSASADPSADAAQVREVVRGAFGDFNLFSFLTLGLGAANRGSIPGLPKLDRAPSPLPMTPIGDPTTAVALVLGLQVIGLFLGAWYLGLIGQRVRGEDTDLWRLARRVWGYWGSMAGFLALLYGVVLLLSVPAGLTLGMAWAFAPDAAPLLLVALIAAAQVASLWVVLFMFFVVDAAVVGELGPLKAARSSMHVVASNFWSAATFIALYLLVTYGTLVLWGQLGSAPWATAVAIVGNAYVASGLAAGSMIYYRARVALPEQRGAARAQPRGG